MSRTNQSKDVSSNYIPENRVELPEIEIIRTNKIANVDADILLYWILAATDEADTEEEAISNLDAMIRSFEKTLDAKGYLYFLSGTGNFRYLIGDERRYKGNRTTERHRHYSLIKNQFIKRHNAMLIDFMEADDALSIFQSEKTILCTIDKDLKQCPGEHYHLQKKELFTVSEEEAHRHLWMQALTGDTTDCILGVKGIGPSKAAAVLDQVKPNEYPNAVLSEYIRTYGITNGSDLFTENYNLVRMKTSRGEYIQEKFEDIFLLIDYLYNL